MSIFKKNADGASVNDTALPDGKQDNKDTARKKKGKTGVEENFNESVVETVVSRIAENSRFVTDVDGEEMYACLLLDVADIGGFDRKTARKDESKGSIARLVNSGSIATLLTPPLMADDKMVIVPDVVTLKAMEEFSILRDAPYEVCLVHGDGGVQLTGNKVGYFDACDVANGIKPLDEFIGRLDGDGDGLGGVSGGNGPIMGSMDDEPIPLDEDDELLSEEMPVGGGYMYDGPGDDDLFGDEVHDTADRETVASVQETDASGTAPLADEADAPSGGSMADFDPPVPDSSYLGAPDDAMADLDADQAELVPDELVYGAVHRKFYSDDLGLEVSTDAFDAQFVHGNPNLWFMTDRPVDDKSPDGWMNQYLNQIANEANADMRRLHQANLFSMREFYFKLISAHCDEITKQLDIEDPESQYGQFFCAIRQRRVANEEKLDEMVGERRDALEADWKAHLEQVGEDAKRAAQQQYRERYGRQHEDDVVHVESAALAMIEDDYQNALRDMHTRRKAEAQRRMDMGVTAALKAVSEQYSECLKQEDERYDMWMRRLTDYVDENRKDALARSQALQDDLVRNDLVARQREEHATHIKEMTADFDKRQMQLNEDIAKMVRSNEDRIRELNADWQGRLDTSRRENEELRKQVDNLLDSISKLDAQKDAEYKSRINELKNERDAMQDQLDHAASMHKRTNMVSIFFVVVLAIMALAIGFIGGERVNISSHADDYLESILNQQQNGVAAPELPGTPQG